MRVPDGFESGFTTVNDVRLHRLIGGEGPPLLVVAGWPQTWAAWRFCMPELAKDYRVVVAEFRGQGQSDKPDGGYDLGTLAQDLADLMAELGHDRFCYVGHDIGCWIGFALAADHPQRVSRMAVIDANVPGLTPSPPLMMPPALHLKLWHFAFNQVPDLPEQLVAGRERIFLAWQFNNKAHNKAPVLEALDHYAEAYAQPGALRASFGWYRATQENIRRNQERAKGKLNMPVLAIGGAQGLGAAMEAAFKDVAPDLQVAVIEECGHYVPEEQPEALLALITPFLAAGRQAT